VGRMFPAGDAAHEVTPSGGFGMNTGILDAHNLAWELSAALRGWACAVIAETYDAERRPVGQAVVTQRVRNRAETASAAGRGARHSPNGGIPSNASGGPAPAEERLKYSAADERVGGDPRHGVHLARARARGYSPA
jgi:putative polyketide hydroxylase